MTVNALAPTVFRSPLTAWMFGDDERAHTTRVGMLSRFHWADWVSPMTSRARSDFHTGHIVYADGGYTTG